MKKFFQFFGTKKGVWLFWIPVGLITKFFFPEIPKEVLAAGLVLSVVWVGIYDELKKQKKKKKKN